MNKDGLEFIFALLRTIVIIAIAMIMLAMWHEKAHSHETDEWKHQVGSLHSYGGNSYIVWVNPEQTECLYMYFNHGQMHVTETFACDENLKPTEDE
jgi:hypothetical protein